MTGPESPPSCVAGLYGAHHGWLQQWLTRRLGDASDAADLAQDAFVRVLRSQLRFETPPQARLYLRTIAQGLCVDLWRRRTVEQAWLEALAAQPEASAASAEHQAIVLQALYEIDAMLRQLPPRASQAFVLSMAFEMTDREVADILKVSTRMVRKYVAQGMLHCLRLEASGALAA